jgi:hypothetical protein
MKNTKRKAQPTAQDVLAQVNAAREAAKLAGPEVRRFQSWAEEVNP